MFAETMSGLGEDPSSHLTTVFEAGHDEMVMVTPCASTCEHHLGPFIGVAHVAYIPGPSGHITGLSKIVRLRRWPCPPPAGAGAPHDAIADALGDVLGSRPGLCPFVRTPPAHTWDVGPSRR